MTELDQIKQALGREPNNEVVALANILENKKEVRELWNTKVGKDTLKALTDDCVYCLSKALQFESMTYDEVKSYLSRYRSNITLVGTLTDSNNTAVIQSMLDEAVKLNAR